MRAKGEGRARDWRATAAVRDAQPGSRNGTAVPTWADRHLHDSPAASRTRLIRSEDAGKKPDRHWRTQA